MLTPYLGRDNIDRDQRRFNYLHSESRMVIEHSFGELKSRWRELLLQVHATPERACTFIISCATLHNICRFYDDKFWPEWDINEQQLNEINRIQPHDGRNDVFNEIRDQNLLQWRDRLCLRMSERRAQERI